MSTQSHCIETGPSRAVGNIAKDIVSSERQFNNFTISRIVNEESATSVNESTLENEKKIKANIARESEEAPMRVQKLAKRPRVECKKTKRLQQIAARFNAPKAASITVQNEKASNVYKLYNSFNKKQKEQKFCVTKLQTNACKGCLCHSAVNKGPRGEQDRPPAAPPHRHVQPSSLLSISPLWSIGTGRNYLINRKKAFPELSSQPNMMNSCLSPIIIVPPLQSHINNMCNAKDILQDLKFVSTKGKKREGAPHVCEILLRKKTGGGTVPYWIINNPQKLQSSDWHRVVAVFVMGPAWQFKGWPWDGNPTEIFSKICGFHLKYDEMPLNQNVEGWDVTVIQISKTQRHLDRAALRGFWDRLDKFMMRRKHFYNFNFF